MLISSICTDIHKNSIIGTLKITAAALNRCSVVRISGIRDSGVPCIVEVGTASMLCSIVGVDGIRDLSILGTYPETPTAVGARTIIGIGSPGYLC